MPCERAVVVRNQGELDQAISDGYTEVVIDPEDESAKMVVKKVNVPVSQRAPTWVFRVLGGHVETSSTVTVVASGTAVIDAKGNCAVMALERSRVNAYDDSRVTACDDSTVYAHDRSMVLTFHSAQSMCFDVSTAFVMGLGVPTKSSVSCAVVFFASSRKPAASPEPDSDPVPAVVFDGPEELLFDDA